MFFGGSVCGEQMIPAHDIWDNVDLQVVENRGPSEVEIMMHFLDMEEGDIIYTMFGWRTIVKKIPT